MKKIFVVSDIHGHCTLLQKALERAGFDDANEDHLLICCGDYFDRGTENAEVMKFFEKEKGTYNNINGYIDIYYSMYPFI